MAHQPGELITLYMYKFPSIGPDGKPDKATVPEAITDVLSFDVDVETKVMTVERTEDRKIPYVNLDHYGMVYAMRTETRQKVEEGMQKLALSTVVGAFDHLYQPTPADIDMKMAIETGHTDLGVPESHMMFVPWLAPSFLRNIVPTKVDAEFMEQAAAAATSEETSDDA